MTERNVADELERLASLKERGILTDEEFRAQKAALLGSVAPPVQPTVAVDPAPAAQKGTKTGIGCLAFLGGLVVIAIILFVVGSSLPSGGKNEAQTDTAAPAAPPLKVTAVELARAYQANEARAQETYGDQRLEVSGTVAGVDLNLVDNPVVQLRTDNEFMPAQANLTDASKPKAAHLDKGERIKLICEKVSEVISIPQLDDCDIE